MVIFYKKWKKYNETQLTKKQNGLKYSKNDKSSTLPRYHMERGGMPLHDAVGINCKNGATTEHQDSAVKYMG